jgi:D-alanyl-D-alanine carboxypeptidase
VTRVLADSVRTLVSMLVIGLMVNLLLGFPATAVPYAAYLMDARTGATLYSQNADTPLAPASLTKMMTLYITFQEIEAGHVSLDTMVTVSKNAANQAPSRLGLQAGQKIALRYLIRAAAVKSANDAAAAIGDYFAGSPEKWGARMTATARQLGMKNSTFKNANGLPAKGHLSTAHDMSLLGRHLFYDFPQYYNIFSRRTTDAGLATVASTNRKFLDSYDGADGIKTGYTAAAGFNLTASAERNGVRLIGTIMGGTSTPMRNQKMSDLLDMGFRTAKPGMTMMAAKPADPEIAPPLDPALVAQSTDEDLPEVANGAGKTLRVATNVTASPRPTARPAAQVVAVTGIEDAVAQVTSAQTAPPDDSLEGQAAALASVVTVKASAPAQPLTLAAETAQAPKRNAPIYTDANAKLASVPAKPEVVTRVSTSSANTWGINLGRYPNSMAAEKALIQIQLAENTTLGDGLRKVVARNNGYDAVVMGLDRDTADLACRRLQSRSVQCFTMGQ